MVAAAAVAGRLADVRAFDDRNRPDGPFTRFSGCAAPFTAPNVNTDVIMPKTFLKGIDRKGLDLGASICCASRMVSLTRTSFSIDRAIQTPAS